MSNFIIASDAYKWSHPKMVPTGMRKTTSYIEPRKGEDIVFFGLQAYIRKYLSKRITVEDINEAELYAKSAFIPFCREMWEDVVYKHDGFLPIKIQALPEGSIVRKGTPVVQVESYGRWPFASLIETAILRAIWYPSTVATTSRKIKKVIKSYLEKTSDKDPNTLLPTQLNDFGARGCSSGETAGIGGLAHLLNFLGSDTMEAIPEAIKYYDHNINDGPVLISVPATEHSVTTMAGRDGEEAFARQVIEAYKDYPFISIVSDTYDLENFVLNVIGTNLNSLVENHNGTIVIRPDSGDPKTIVSEVCGMLYSKFGGTHNSKGYIVLNPKVRVIQGDGIELVSIIEILDNLVSHGFSTENVCFGMGGKLLQAPMRDDYGWAMKANEVTVYNVDTKEDETRKIQKVPKTDLSKASKRGRQAVIDINGHFIPLAEDTMPTPDTASHGVKNWLETVWDNGKVIRTQTLTEIRNNVEI